MTCHVLRPKKTFSSKRMIQKVALTKHILMTKSSNNSMETPKTKLQATKVIRTTQIHFEKGQRLVAWILSCRLAVINKLVPRVDRPTLVGGSGAGLTRNIRSWGPENQIFRGMSTPRQHHSPPAKRKGRPTTRERKSWKNWADSKVSRKVSAQTTEQWKFF